MQSINAGFQSLKTLIPHTDGEKLSKVSGTSPRLRRHRTQMLVLHQEIFGIACWAGQSCKSDLGYFYVLIWQWRSPGENSAVGVGVHLKAGVQSGLGVCDSTLQRRSRVACAQVMRWPCCRGEQGEEVVHGSRSGS